ncbi:hypothetical protein QYM36_017847 [Artemia franciscana]|uniref:Uncharacterized protein n=1 Tax=Artemia franciscana TaxID=6661 RepID=A0AA88H801_ARTSF|nr:hypothetical protein QYM36_017847 [Artemia franciscana]
MTTYNIDKSTFTLMEDGQDKDAKILKKKKKIHHLEGIGRKIRLTRSKHAQMRSEEESETLRVELRSLLPTSLQRQNEGLNECDESDIRAANQNGKIRQQDLKSCEVSVINEFLDNHSDSVLVNLMWELLNTLSDKWEMVWPVELSSAFCELYTRVMTHRRHPDVIHSYLGDQSILQDIRVCLLSCELRIATRMCIEHDDLSIFADPLTCDLTYLTQILLVKESLFETNDLLLLRLRAHYAQFNHFKSLGWLRQGQFAAEVVLNIFDDLKKLKANADGFFIKDKLGTSFITESMCEANLDVIKRSAQMSNLIELFEKRQYSRIVELVKWSFQISKKVRSKGFERSNEIAIFIEALFEMKEYKVSLYSY